MATLGMFTNQSFDDNLCFNEGPIYVPIIDAHNTSSIDTTSIDAYRQGVELTQNKHFDAGGIKIHSGEPGHRLVQSSYGVQHNIRPEKWFSDADNFSAIKYIESQEDNSPIYSAILTYPIITGDNSQLESHNFDAVIEPLTIRLKISFMSIDVPFEAHDIRGEIMGGNKDAYHAVGTIKNTYRFDSRPDNDGYLDDPYVFEHAVTSIKPFSDVRLAVESPNMKDILDRLNGNGLVQSLEVMQWVRDDGYVSMNENACSAGWTYSHNDSCGTDSIAFGGLAY